MKIFRPALRSDLQTVHALQNVPYRDRVYALPLPPYENFQEETLEKLKNQEKFLYVLEEDQIPIGYTEYFKSPKGWDLIFWGKWLNTLAYASVKVAFEDLRLPKLSGVVRQENKRTIRILEKFDIRRVRKDYHLYYKPVIFGLASTYLYYYEITPEEFQERSGLMRQQSLGVIFRL